MVQNHLCKTAPPPKTGLVIVYVCVSLCERVHCPETVLLNQSTALGPGSWALCHILSLPTRPPAAHQEEEIRTIPSCHCPTTRAHKEERAYTHTHWNLFTLVIFKKLTNSIMGFSITLQ